MNWFRNLKTLHKLLLSFFLMAIFMGVIGYQGLSAANTLNGMVEDMYQKHLIGLSAMQQASLALTKAGSSVRTIILTSDAAEEAQLARDVDISLEEMDKQLVIAEKSLVTDSGKATMAKLKETRAKYDVVVHESVRLALAHKDKEAYENVRAGKTLSDPMREYLGSLTKAKEALGKAAYDEGNAIYSNLRKTLIALVFVVAMFSMALGYFVAQLIARPLSKTVEMLERVAQKDLTAKLEIHTKDEVGQMAESLNQATEAIRTALYEVSRSAESMAASSEELASASEELASGTQEQAASLEETTSTMEEITATVKQNADNAKEANQVASASRDTAEKGGKVVTEAVVAMGAINDSSKNIAEIITTIDEIAFQTNLLALNAAVEAARAGEQGRGFAVVATEVRNLAQRSATSAKEIKRLIQDSVLKVENGSTLVNKSGENLHEIVGSVKRVTDIVAEIAAASREQSVGIEQVNKAMLQMDQVTQNNASQTEELSSTAQLLASNAEELQALVGQFRLDEGGQSHVSKIMASPKPTATPTRKQRAATRNGSDNGSSVKVKPNGHDVESGVFADF